MKRTLTAMALAAITILAFSWPADAAVSKVTHIKFHGPYAEAYWVATSGTTQTLTFINVSTTATGMRLVVDNLVGEVNAEGNIPDFTETIADVTSGFSFSSDRVKLTTASLTAADIPAQRCLVTAESPITDCTEVTITVSATWTGEGPVTRGVVNEHFKTAGVVLANHINGTTRAATAAGSIGDGTLSPGDLLFASLGDTRSGTTSISP